MTEINDYARRGFWQVSAVKLLYMPTVKFRTLNTPKTRIRRFRQDTLAADIVGVT